MAGGAKPMSALGLALLILSSCERMGPSLPTEKVEGRTRSSVAREGVRVWRDPGTGCQYLLWDSSRRGGITPRLGSDGRPRCG